MIAAWNETAFPDESFTLTGKAFTTQRGEAEGSDTTVWVGGPTAAGFQVKQAQVWNVDDKILTATIPADLPLGMFLVWVENSEGISAPIAINRSRPQWIGPKGNIVAPGGKARVFGRNLSRNHGTSEAFVYAKASSSSSFNALTVGKVEPFAVEFTAPSSPGAYDIYVHNGHGGSYGWGEPLKLIVQQPWVRDSYTIIVPPSGGDDTAAIQNALGQVASRQNGGTVQLQAGTYITTAQVKIPAKARIIGAGRDLTKVELRYNTYQNIGFSIDGDRVTIEHMELRFLSGTAGAGSILSGCCSTKSEIFLNNIRVRANANTTTLMGQDESLWMRRSEVSNIEFWKVFHLWESADTWIHDNKFYGDRFTTVGQNFPESAVHTSQSSNICFENNHAETPSWTSTPAIGAQLAISMLLSDLNGRLGLGLENFFISGNTTKDTYPVSNYDSNKGEIILFHDGCCVLF